MKKTLQMRLFDPHFESLKYVGIVAIVVVLGVCGPRAEAQQPGKIFRIGFFDPSTSSGMAVLVNVFRQELWSDTNPCRQEGHCNDSHRHEF
jgi:hypothetical protein